MQKRRVLRLGVVCCVFMVALPTRAADEGLELAEAAREALASNLDLAAQRLALDADREEIAIARSVLLPQIDLGAQGQILEDDRSDGSRGSVTERSVTLNARLTQVLYDESDWASFEIQKYVYAAQEQQYEAFRLNVVEAAANAFLELDRSQTLVDVYQRDRGLTLRNIETSRARIAAGYSSETEILRWQSQLAMNNSNIAGAQAQVLASRFALNRVRNQPREASVAVRPASLEDYGFVYAHDPITKALADPDAERKLRDVLVRVGLERSPVLAESGEAIAAAERQLTANRRAFWVPSLALVAGVNHLAEDGSGSAPDFDETEWGVGASLSFPLLQGGAKFANQRQAEEYLASLRTQRRADVVTLGERVRSSFAKASAAYAIIAFARDQQSAAQRYFDLTNQSYVLGVASLIQLVDAQTQLLDAELSVTNALYDFFEAAVAAEGEIAFFPFLEADAEVAELLDQIERQLQISP